MLKNYFTIAWRSLVNNKLYTIINTLGLTVGVSSCLVIYLIVSFELSFNKGIPAADRIYRIYSNFSGAFEGTNCGVNTGVQAFVKEQFTGLENTTAFYTYGGKVTIVEKDIKDFEDQNFTAIVEPSYFNLVEGYTWKEGSSKTSLEKPFQVVLTEEKAKKYFGTDDASKIMGKEIRYNDSLVVNVSGIVKSLPYRTDFEFTDFISTSTIEKSFLKKIIRMNNWESTNSNSQLFVRLDKSTTVQKLESQLAKANAQYNQHEGNKNEAFKIDYRLQPISDLHFNGTLGIFDGSRPAALKSTLSTLTIVAILLLLIAAINFINLQTAQAVKRAKEVGVRKVLGSSRFQLISHFLAQSILLTLFAVLLSLPLAELGLGFFHDFVPKGVTSQFADISTLLFLVGIVFVVGILAGLYPAFFLSSFLPALALKNQALINSSQTRTNYLRKALTVFQFSIAQALIIGTLVVISQINFMLTKDLGFKKDSIIHFNTNWFEQEGKRFVLKTELERIPEVAELSMCSSSPSDFGYNSMVLDYKRGKEEINTNVFTKFGDENYIPLYDIKIIAGRNLLPTDSMREIIVNESYLKELHLTPDEAIGKEIWQEKNSYPIVGVVKDFHTSHLQFGYQPVFIGNERSSLYGFSVKLAASKNRTTTYQEAITKIENAWYKVYPDRKFEYKFVDDKIKSFYETEQRMSTLTTTAMTIAIIICSLGLFGLVSYTSIQRTKEIGIRKVMGATINNIVLLLSQDFLLLVVVAFVIATPVAYYGADKFLNDYAFHTDLNWYLFASAGGASVILAFVTVSYQVIKAAVINPVESLRSE